MSLAIWLLPLVGVALTSVRSIDDLNRGNLWGWPSEFRLVENYAAVFADTRMAQFILNSVLITVPAVAGAVALACMAGFALAKYRFRGNLAAVRHLHRRQPRAVPDADDPGARPDDRTSASTTRAGR